VPNQGDDQLPEVIRRYFAAHDRRDADTSSLAFATDARVFDDGREYRGQKEIHDWLGRASTQFTYTRTFLDAVAEEPGVWLVRNRLEGDFPGGVVDLTYRFRVADDLIVDLIIEP
jgi:hypothetical protein